MSDIVSATLATILGSILAVLVLHLLGMSWRRIFRSFMTGACLLMFVIAWLGIALGIYVIAVEGFRDNVLYLAAYPWIAYVTTRGVIKIWKTGEPV